ncbi:MAG: 2-dehydropantoate 2-reductase [Pseudomonadota bacterium]|nr:2-dehydropantoate 2-reductase [Pseudomonadota bacterium]
MRICVIGGGGAIGGYLAVALARAGNEVTVMARGATLAAIRERGLQLIMPETGETLHARVNSVEHLADAGAQDLVILAVKAHQVTPVAAELAAMLAAQPDCVLIPMQNGIPFWYFQRHGGPFEGRAIETVDPDGLVMKRINPQQVIGCVVYPATTTEGPGIIRHVEGNRFPIGELDGQTTERATRIADAFVAAGLKSPILDNIRAEIWLKLWGNMTFNPISALTHGTLEGICQYPLTRELSRAMMTEAQTIANKLGITFRVDIERRIAGAEKVGRHKTSMLQDLEAGRALEVDALLGSVIELGRITDTPTPCLNTVFALTKLLDHAVQASHGRLALPDQAH